MIGCLLYLTTSRPDISSSVGVCARFQANPKMSHLTAIKRIIKYVSRTSEFGLFYSKESNVSLARYFVCMFSSFVLVSQTLMVYD